MAGHVLSVGGKIFYLSTNVDEVKAAIVSAVRRGGDFVPILSGGRTSSILISPGIRVILEEVLASGDDGVNDPYAIETYDESFDDWGL